MKLSRDLTLKINFLFDQCLPPLLRDARWFMWLPFKLLFGQRAEIFFQFKDRAPGLSAEQFAQVYRDAAPVFIQRDTDLNKAGIDAIESHVVGPSVLDIACGRGFLARRLAAHYRVTAADIVLDPALAAAHPAIRFQQANIEALPFADREFDTVVCTHTLEHVQHLAQAVHELRRVCARRLIIVVPRQRPYRYTFDLHLHFFPYVTSLLQVMGATGGHQQCHNVYLEDRDGCASMVTKEPLVHAVQQQD